ncbi:MAG: isopentenyl-diphosphate Delta-isomerase [Chitinophagaceae bacterium]|nr:isopentenyl-diphosphate Delta-isomerase [Chitinophagaceae bacterium]
MQEERVILVDENDEPLGEMEKMQAHRTGALHRAFSIFLFNKKGEMLLQKRADDKYHSGGLWTNACCSHPRPGEEIAEAARRRLMEEMGIETRLQKAFHFIYKTRVSNNLTEHELDHIFTGEFDGPVPFNPDEVSEICFKTPAEIRKWLNTHPEQFTEWFRLAFERVLSWHQQHMNGKNV